MSPMLMDAPFRWAEPKSWPWFLYLWLAFLLLGWLVPAWKWLRRKRAGAWPAAQGHIETVEITKRRFSLTTQRGSHVAQLGYSYAVTGVSYSGRYRHECGTEREAEEFVRDLQGKPVVIHYNPGKPSDCSMLEPDLATLLQARAPTDESFNAVASLPAWSKPFLWFFAGLSAIGLSISIWLHVAVLMGRTPPSAAWSLHVGIFVVWFPAVFAAQGMVGYPKRKDLWKVILRNAPDWMRYMVYGFFAYGFRLFVFDMFKDPALSGLNSPSSKWRGFTGTWMIFYSAALAILYSAAETVDRTPRCLNGHTVPSQAKFCAQCGQPILNAKP
jgi:Protein of unknown function (DUF3592)